MYHRVYPITPDQSATNGALSIFVEGCRRDNVRHQLIGLSVLQSANESQIQTAIRGLQATHGVAPAEIHALFARA